MLWLFPIYSTPHCLSVDGDLKVFVDKCEQGEAANPTINLSFNTWEDSVLSLSRSQTLTRTNTHTV